MRADETDAVDTASPLNDLPQFDLDYELDDPIEPTEVTVYEADAGDDTTNWITVAVADAIDLVDVS
ncbi:MAG TPA: hypothetical protein VKA37_07580 [Halobacteriales archaeon]|nr:hypothetical protein [Halobacteriales archaeon]